jgi:CBS domain-containing protein
MSKSDAFLQAGKTAVLQNIHGTMQFLQRFPPFNHMENTHLAYLVEQCQLRFYAPGESIIRPTDGPVEHFYIVKQGRVVGERTHEGREEAQTTFEITAGECFPLAALLGERAHPHRTPRRRRYVLPATEQARIYQAVCLV